VAALIRRASTALLLASFDSLVYERIGLIMFNYNSEIYEGPKYWVGDYFTDAFRCGIGGIGVRQEWVKIG